MKIKCNGQDILSNNFTDKDKRKLDSVQPCANYYKHPIRDGYKHLPAGGQEGQTVIHDGTNATWGNIRTLPDGGSLGQIPMLSGYGPSGVSWTDLRQLPRGGMEGDVLYFNHSGAIWKDAKEVWSNDDVFAYGVQFSVNVADPHLTRIGNMSLHKSLPIQSQLKGCIAQGGKIIYWLNESDWRFRKEAITKSVELTVAGDIYTMVADVFNTLQYDKQWVKVDGVACQISSIDTSTNTATLLVNDDLKALSLSSGTKSIELGAVLNGYDGTVRVYCPEFYIKSINKDSVCKVYISTDNVDNTYTKQPTVLLDAYKSTVLNTVPENMGYLSTLPVNSAVSVVNNNTYCRGGDISNYYDKYLATDPIRANLGKPRTYLDRASMRTYSRNAGSQMLSYDQYKNIFYWLYVIEYANFNSQEAYNATFTDEGYRQGGIGAGITTMNEWYQYNQKQPITPCGYGNTLGNRTGLVPLTIPEFTSFTSDATVVNGLTMQMPRWRGFDNPFGDISTNLDGAILNRYAKFYTCHDASKYADTINDYYVYISNLGSFNKYIMHFVTGDAAHIIPYEEGGDATKYICDYCKITIPYTNEFSTVIVGGNADEGSYAGLCCFDFTYRADRKSGRNVGFRTVSEFVSFPSDK